MTNSVNIPRFGQFVGQSKMDIMQTQAETQLNKLRYNLSPEAKKRLKWMYIVKFDCDNNISRAAKKIGISRPWLSQIHTKWLSCHEDPRSLEPESRAPHDTSNRKTIDKTAQEKIIAIRKRHKTWGKDKIAGCLKHQHDTEVGSTTVNRYLHKNNLIDIKLSDRNKSYWRNKQEKNKQTKFKMRPPKEIKDHKPGALIEKDMKLIVKMGQSANSNKLRAKGNYYYQHTYIDSFTRLRLIGLAENSDSQTATTTLAEIESRWPFPIACVNNDNGSENNGDFSDYLEHENIFQFFSRTGTPTDNPRVERSHLTDDLEFYNQGNIYSSFEKQNQACLEWERVYNYERPHQALGQLTPMQFYELWRKAPEMAYAITEKYQAKMKRQKMRQANSRRMKKREQIEKLMENIEQKLQNNSIKKC